MEQSKMPWEEDWGVVEASQPQEQATGTKMPWELDWGFLDPAKQVVKNKVESIQFDTVFNRLVGAESRGQHRTKSGELLTSPVGAQGVTQVMPKTGQDPGYGIKPLQDDSEEEYMRFGRDYLQAMLKKFDGDYRKAVASYNAGPGNVDKAVREAQSKGGDWTEYLPKKSETLPYMRKILGENYGA